MAELHPASMQIAWWLLTGAGHRTLPLLRHAKVCRQHVSQAQDGQHLHCKGMDACMPCGSCNQQL